MSEKKVYIALSTGFIHSGHLNVIKKANELGQVTVGLLTDKAIASFKRIPLLDYNERKILVENIKGVSQIIPQNTISYAENLKALKPDFVVHGDDWKEGPQEIVRNEVIQLLNQWGGELIEIPYTKGLSGSDLEQKISQRGTTPDIRMKTLRRLLMVKPIIRILEAHNGLCGLITERTKVTKNGVSLEFDGMWESSLTDSTSKGKPDTSAVDVTSRLQTIEQILEVTTKPMIVDADNGGLSEHFSFTVRNLERLGVSAVIIEDKVGAKRNSLFGTDVDQTQDTKEDFADKILTGKKAQITKDFMIIARIESLILSKGLDDAIERAVAYVNAGADGIMIHSKEKTPDEVISFCRKFREFSKTVPLVVVPTTYSTITEEELAAEGVNIVIYANHLLRSAFPAMVKTAEEILLNSRCYEANQSCLSVKEILTLIPSHH